MIYFLKRIMFLGYNMLFYKFHKNIYKKSEKNNTEDGLDILFQSSIGKRINADVNGSLNILRKVAGNEFLSSRGLSLTQ